MFERVTVRILFGGIASWCGRAVNVLLGLVLMPVLFRHLPSQELGAWLLLGQSWAALTIFDLGFGVILTRRIAFANAAKAGSGAALAEVADLVATGRRVYGVLGIIALVLSFGAGCFFLRKIDLAGQSATTIWFAWGAMCLSQAIALWAAVWTCLLQGLGYIGWDTILAALVNSLTLLAQIALVFFGGGVVGLAVFAASGALVQRLLIIRFVKRRRPDLALLAGKWSTVKFKEMIAPALRAWLTSLGYLLVANTDQFFVTAYKGTTALPAYRAAFLLVINLHLLAGVFSAASPIFISHLWKTGDLEKARSILRRNARIGLWSMACGAGAIIAMGPVFFDFWLGAGNFIGYPVLGIFLITFLLEHHANVFSTCGRATDDEAYAASSILTGVLKLFLAWLLTSRFGLIGLACSTLVAQGAINDWFMVRRSAVRLKVNFADHCREVLLPIGLLFAAALGSGCLVKALTPDLNPTARIVLISAPAMVLLAVSLWRLALEHSQRAWLLRRIKFA
ncbi:MAG TPA: hypothetical protein VL793_03075 [Patescibacteria group bacterium]|nr:hypothetical protein [Patescibacteria group bacterium]